MFQDRFKKLLWQLPSLIIVAGLIALLSNHLRSDGIALVGNWSVDARYADAAGDSLVISLAQAVQGFKQDTVLFLDARPQEQYVQGHIRGALSIPGQEADRYFMETADRLDNADMLIAYCDGESCDLSHELALFLKQMGYANVRVLVNGWSVWRQAGLPTSTENDG
jgi:rhodanese-related sulfurtransferase